MVKYRQYYLQMVTEHQALFTEFKKIHDAFVTDRPTWSEKFNEFGSKVVEIIRQYDRLLCSGMSRGKFSGYSQQLSEKFWAEVKKEYSHIDMVGVKITKKVV